MEGENTTAASFSGKTACTGIKSGIKSWAPDDRPREKLLLKGVQALSTAELLAILIRTGNKQDTALGLAQRLLGTVTNDLGDLSRLSVADFTRIKGLGKVKAVTIIAALELGRRRQSGGPVEKRVIHNSSDAARILQPLLADYRHEVFAVVFLNQSNRVNHQEVISTGGITGTVADPKIIMRKALEHDAVKIILCPNHPSGNLRPSKEDVNLTVKLRDAALLLDMRVLDHLIVSTLGYLSFADEDLL
jgi:DNA repair protein RadC